MEVPVAKDAAQEANKMDTDETPSDAAPPASAEADVNMQDAKSGADAPGVENGVPETGEKAVQMETDIKVSCYCLCELVIVFFYHWIILCLYVPFSILIRLI